MYSLCFCNRLYVVCNAAYLLLMHPHNIQKCILFSAAANTGTSLVLSSLLSVLVFAGMQMFSKQLGSTEWLTIVGGFLGSVLFICSLTVSSFESYISSLITDNWPGCFHSGSSFTICLEKLLHSLICYAGIQ
jgi:hypothetical protein